MLILTRKIGESVTIGDDIRVVVMEIRGKQVRLGIEAPADMVVLRDEVSRRPPPPPEDQRVPDFQLSDLQTLKESIGVRIRGGIPPPTAPPAVPGLTVQSAKFGAVQISEDQIITFDQGILGLGRSHQSVLLSRSELHPFLLLQCLDDPNQALAVIDPASLAVDFWLGLATSFVSELKASSPAELQLFVTLNIPPGRADETTVNLFSPILINLRSRLGLQVNLEPRNSAGKYRLLGD